MAVDALSLITHEGVRNTYLATTMTSSRIWFIFGNSSRSREL